MDSNCKQADTSSRLISIASYTCNFLLVCVMFLICAKLSNLYPLGDVMFMLNDMNAQYVDFFAWFKDILTGEANPYYVSTQGLGGNAAGLFAYYVVSPFNLLVAFFSEEDIDTFFFITTMLKLGCIQMAMIFYLCRRFKLSFVWASAIALGFTFSVWIVTQVRNIMWLDALYLMPLCAWGICCLLRDGKWRLFTISLALAIIFNWYMAYMLVIFFCFYILFEGYALGYEGVKSFGRTHRKRLIQFALCMLLALGISAIVFLPAVLSMAGDGTMVDMATRIQMAQDMLAKHIPALANVSVVLLIGIAIAFVFAILVVLLIVFRKRTLRQKIAIVLFTFLCLCFVSCLIVAGLRQGSLLGLLEGVFLGYWQNDKIPQIFASTPILILAIWFFCTKRIPRKLKLALGLFLFLLILSSWARLLMIIWGGLRLPHGYHSRMSFLATFMIIWAAAYLVRAVLNEPGKASFMLKKWLSWAVLAFTIVELLIRTVLLWQYLYSMAYQSWFDDYMADAYVQAEELEEYDPGVYRVEKTYLRNNEPALNEGMTLGFNQLSSYASTTDQAVIGFLTPLGYSDNGFLTFGLHPTLLGETLFGIKYVSMFAPQYVGFDDVGLTAVESGAKFYENPYALSLGYGSSYSIFDMEVPAIGDKYNALQDFASAIVGHSLDLYTKDSEGEMQLDMEAFVDFVDQVSQNQMTFDAFEPGYIKGSFFAAEDQVLLLTIPNQDGWEIFVDGEEVVAQDVANGALMAIPVSVGDNSIEMRFTPPGIYAGLGVTVISILIVILLPLIRRRYSG